MKLFIILVLATIGTFMNAQSPFEQIVKAENSFEKMCLDSGIKKGFLNFMDTTAVAFTKNRIENARVFWQSLPEFPGIYSWAPTFAEVSVSGDWGYTTGAVEFRDSSLNDKPSSYSQYTTVWHINNKGEWKYLADIGTVHGPEVIDRTPKEVKAVKVPFKNVSKEVILNQESLYSQQLNADGSKAIRKYFGKSFILNLKGHAIITSVDTALQLLKAPSPFMSYKPLDVKISPKGDMALVYGNLLYKESKDYYIRIWRREPSGWKIALEVAKL